MVESMTWKRAIIEKMISRVAETEDRERFEAYFEGFYTDEVSLDELIDDLRAYHIQERKFG